VGRSALPAGKAVSMASGSAPRASALRRASWTGLAVSALIHVSALTILAFTLRSAPSASRVAGITVAASFRSGPATGEPAPGAVQVVSDVSQLTGRLLLAKIET
jgi:hypothetical protein